MPTLDEILDAAPEPTNGKSSRVSAFDADDVNEAVDDLARALGVKITDRALAKEALHRLALASLERLEDEEDGETAARPSLAQVLGEDPGPGELD